MEKQLYRANSKLWNDANEIMTTMSLTWFSSFVISLVSFRPEVDPLSTAFSGSTIVILSHRVMYHRYFGLSLPISEVQVGLG